MTKRKDPKDIKPSGRPTKYKETLGNDLIELGKVGKLPAQVASSFGVTKQTLHEWRGAYPVFSDAYAIYKEHCENWWLDLAQSQAQGGIGNFNATKFMLAAAFRYTEKTEVVTDPDKSEEKFEVVLNYTKPEPKAE